MSEKRIIQDEYESTLSDEDRKVGAECARGHVVATISTTVTQTPDMIKDEESSNQGGE